MKEFKEWDGFEGKIWKEEINTRDFIQKNYTPYDGDESFLAGPTDATNQLWGELQKLQKEERANNGVLDMETEVVSSLTAYGPGYIKEELKDLEKIVGLQTDKPLKRALCHTVVSRWQSRHVQLMVTHQIQSLIKFLTNTTKHTMLLFLMRIHQR